MTATDIQVGDLIKATNKGDPEQTFTGRVLAMAHDWFSVQSAGSRSFRFWNIEVLERPIPPVEEELLEKAVEAYRTSWSFAPDPTAVTYYGPAFTAVINAVREFDKSKENSK